jgi:hypothetical protein
MKSVAFKEFLLFQDDLMDIHTLPKKYQRVNYQIDQDSLFFLQRGDYISRKSYTVRMDGDY